MSKLKCDKCGEIEYVLLDGYPVGDRMLEGVMFEIRPAKGEKYKAVVEESAREYFAQLNAKKWLKDMAEYAAETDIATCPKCEEDVVMPGYEVKPEEPGTEIQMGNIGDILKGL